MYEELERWKLIESYILLKTVAILKWNIRCIYEFSKKISIKWLLVVTSIEQKLVAI